jgi:hypothetical protein
LSTSCSAIFVHLAVREPDLGPDLGSMINAFCLINGVEGVNEEGRKMYRSKDFGRRCCEQQLKEIVAVCLPTYVLYVNTPTSGTNSRELNHASQATLPSTYIVINCNTYTSNANICPKSSSYDMYMTNPAPATYHTLERCFQ